MSIIDALFGKGGGGVPMPPPPRPIEPAMSPTDTPRTDALYWELQAKYGSGTFEDVMPKFAELERELAAERALADRLAECLKSWRVEGAASNACFCDAQFAMHGAHPRHDDECISSQEALAAWQSARTSRLPDANG